jgi:cytochrome c peroxidase
MRRGRAAFAALAALAALAAAATPATPASRTAAAPAPGLLDFSAEERKRIASHGPWPPPRERDPSNRIDGRPAAIAFGRALFFDRRLSEGARLACADCHRPDRAFSDGRRVARGRGEGLRNTPSLLDAATRRWYGWDGAHDSLWAASLAALLAEGEMARRSDALAAQVRADPQLAAGYRRAFGERPGSDDERIAVDLAKALAAYQATLATPRTAFDDFRDALLRGDRRAAARYPIDAQRGLRLFIGEGRCSVCHAGAAFTNREFADIGVPFFTPGGVDSGRHGGLQRLLASPMNRLGRHNDAGDASAADPRAVTTRHVVLEHRHFGEFAVPGLRGVARTAPYMHDGSLASIEDVVRHYSELNEERLHADGERILRPLKLSTQQAADLAAFLRSLSR